MFQYSTDAIVAIYRYLTIFSTTFKIQYTINFRWEGIIKKERSIRKLKIKKNMLQ